MNRIIRTLLLLCLPFSTCLAQNERPSYIVSKGADKLLQSYNDLVKGKNICKAENTCVNATMPVNCYTIFNSQFDKPVSFTSWKDDKIFRTMWEHKKSSYDFYGVCYPSTLYFPIDTSGSFDNDDYSLAFIDVAVYKKFADTGNPGVIRNYDSVIRRVSIVNAEMISELVSWSVEGGVEYWPVRIPHVYDNAYSSAGIVVKLKTKDGKTHNCYVISNFDDRTVMWKELKKESGKKEKK